MRNLRRGDYITPNVSLIANDNSVMFNPVVPPRPITFYEKINNNTYNFTSIEGYTWEDFVNSNNNTMNFYISGNYIMCAITGGASHYVCLTNSLSSGSTVKKTDTIIDSYTYYFVSSEPL